MEDDQEICRVCRCESTPDHPLFHPCKCSGSIRFVHQDCLLEWLSHSKKQYCELCEYPFIFTPIYRDDMPDRIPIKVVLRQCVRRSGALLWTCFRAALVATVWLVILPFLTLYIWRFYFWTGESIGFAERLAQYRNQTIEAYNNNNNNNTASSTNDSKSGIFGYDINWFLSECFEGQIITAFVIIVFVAAYLFREWVIQHTPTDTGMEIVDEEPIAVDQPVIQGEPAREAIFAMRNGTPPYDQDDQEHFRQMIRNMAERVHDDNDQHSYGSGSDDTEPTYDDDWHVHHHMDDEHDSHDDEDDDEFVNSSRQPLRASWREEHERHDASSSNVRWRAPEFEEGAAAAAGGSSSAMRPLEEHNQQNNDDNVNQIPRWQNIAPARAPPVAPVPAIAPAPAPAPPPVHDQWNNDNDNNDADMDDDEPFDLREDIDGVLEAIGMRGSMWMLVQNSVLMSLMISLCLGIAIWIPYVIGRLVILIRPISFIHTPISILRFVTDHVVDFVLDYAMPYARSKASWISQLLPEKIYLALQTLDAHVSSLFNAIQSDSTSTLSSATTNTVTSAATNGTVSWGMHVVAMQDKVEMIASVVLDRWHRFALGQSGLDRSICIMMGYLVLIFVGSWYLARSGRITHNDAGNSVNDMIRQQGVFLKVFFFIVLELVLFPTVCGILIDMAALPLFEDATPANRWDFFMENPYSSTFLHWFIGTGFMFHFAVFITLVREVVRPGVMWFIRDPNDPQFNPVQEMVERSVLTLIRKIGASALMYCVLIVAGIGSVTFVVSQYSGLYPLRWSFDTPLSTVALDLLAVQFLVPPLVSYIKPRELSKKAFTDWCLAASRQLRLSSFMFNLRYPDEEGTHVRRTFKAWITRQKATVPSDVFADVAIEEDQDAPVVFKRDGNLARVPKHDSVPVLDNRRMVVPVDPVTLEPLDENERRLGHPAASESGDVENNTMIVYIPPHFRLRFLAFALSTWLAGSALACMVTVLPILLGRHVFDVYLASEKPAHDFYSFIVGAYIMVFLSMTINWISQKYEAFSHSNGSLSAAMSRAYLKQKAGTVLKATYFGVVFGVALPLLLGVAVDMYIFMPIRYSKSTDALVIHISEDWSLGIVYLSIIYGIAQILPANPLQRFLNDTLGNNIMRADTALVTRSLIGPSIMGVIGFILVPGLLALGTVHMLGITDPPMQVALFRCAYPVVFCFAILCGIVLLGSRFARLWLDEVRDATYLVGKRLHNLDEQSTSAAST